MHVCMRLCVRVCVVECVEHLWNSVYNYWAKSISTHILTMASTRYGGQDQCWHDVTRIETKNC